MDKCRLVLFDWKSLDVWTHGRNRKVNETQPLAIRNLLNSEEYAFLRTRPRLGERVILRGLGGSYAYGTNRDGSDVDLRGVTLNLPSDILGFGEFEQFEDVETDTVVYSFNKFVRLLLNCNPNIVELLGLEDDQYLIQSSIGKELLDRKQLFLSKRAAATFSGFADAQLRRLQNATARDRLPQPDREAHILKSTQRALEGFNQRHELDERNRARLFVDKAVTQGLETEIFIEASFERYPLRKFNDLMNTLTSVVRDYDRVGARNRKKDDSHLNKHAMHLVRLLMTGVDLLENAEIRTRRPDDELALLRSVRNGDYMRDGVMTPEFYELVAEYEKKFAEAEAKSKLPENPDFESVEKFVESVNRRIVTGEI